MHASVMAWTEQVVGRYGLADKPVLEVGSQNVNGSVRQFFTGPYLGLDVAPGAGVDVVGDAEELQWDNGLLGGLPFVVISTEALEHVSRPWRAVAEMGRVCQHGGYVIITARGYDERGCWEVHSWPHDVTRFSEQGLRVMAEDAGLEVLESQADPEGPGFFLVAHKP